MAFKRRKLIDARNRVLKRAGVPQKVVVSTRTNTRDGSIAWVEDRAQDPYYYDWGLDQHVYLPESRYSVRILIRHGNTFRSGSQYPEGFRTLRQAIAYMEDLI